MVRKISENPPVELLKALEKTHLDYTDPTHLYHCIAIGLGDSYCGVFGDGDNGAYEWFVWQNNSLETSNAAYGMTEVALRDVLNKVVV